ncbi:MAG TPA: XdhC/CoxI family protein [Caldilineaceae bacterium]|nr:XdhC/CoxI family protein [Caldilineaceae bacterium]
MNQAVLRAMVASLDRREAVALISVTAADGAFAGTVGNHCVVWLEPEREPVGELGLGELTPHVLYDARRALAEREHRSLTYTRTEGTVKLFVEVQVQPSHLVIVGAGHIAVPLASIAATCDFEVTVIDDRPQYAHPSRFPAAKQVIAGPFRAELRKLREQGGLDRHTYIVLVTRGHQHDVECLVEVLDDPLAYIGMIGSQRRIRAVFELLEREQGIDPAKFDRVYAPIGLNIGARTPAEIAVCIMAEIINVMRGGPAVSLSEQIRRERQERRARVAARA